MDCCNLFHLEFLMLYLRLKTCTEEFWIRLDKKIDLFYSGEASNARPAKATTGPGAKIGDRQSSETAGRPGRSSVAHGRSSVDPGRSSVDLGDRRSTWAIVGR